TVQVPIAVATSGSYDLGVGVRDGVGNPADEESPPMATLVVDAEPPELVSDYTALGVYDQGDTNDEKTPSGGLHHARPGDVVFLKFQVAEGYPCLDQEADGTCPLSSVANTLANVYAGATPIPSFAEGAEACEAPCCEVTEGDQGYDYSCTYPIVAGANGPQPVVVMLLDAAGHVTMETVGVVKVDDQAPTIQSAQVTIGGVVTSLKEMLESGPPYVRGGQDVEVTVVFSEGMGTDVSLSPLCGETDAPCPLDGLEVPLAFTPILGPQNGDILHKWSGSLPGDLGTDTEGALLLLVPSGTDQAGNPLETPPVDDTPRVIFDTTPPDAPPVSDTGAITYERTPWGTNLLGPKTSRVRVTPEAAGDMALTAGIEVRIYDSPHADDGALLGKVALNGSGGEPPAASALPPGDPGLAAELDLGDRPQVYLQLVDPAGNVAPVGSPKDPFDLVQHVKWTATMGGKVAESDLENPHQLAATSTWSESLAQPLASELGEPAEPMDTAGAPRWRERVGDGVVPPARSLHTMGMAYDASRAVTVLFGGHAGGPTGNLQDTWEWDGQTWMERTP
ncbi:MAG: hypothetical protein VX938_12645, partial [Myxococcota bacterium]|nr:hypothetical protein [Myxococcota bacterium]